MVPLCILWSVSSLFPFPSITDPSCLNFAVPLKAADSLFHFQSLLFAAFLCIPAAHPTSADIFLWVGPHAAGSTDVSCCVCFFLLFFSVLLLRRCRLKGSCVWETGEQREVLWHIPQKKKKTATDNISIAVWFASFQAGLISGGLWRALPWLRPELNPLQAPFTTLPLRTTFWMYCKTAMALQWHKRGDLSF